MASKITVELARFAERAPEAKALGLEEPFKQAMKAFREPLTGVQMDLSDVVLFDATHLAHTLQISLDKASKDVRIEIEIVTGKIRPIEQATELTKVGAQLDENLKTREATAIAEHEINTIYADTQGLLVGVTDELKKQEGYYIRAQKLGRWIGAQLTPGFEIEDLRPLGYEPAIQQIKRLALATARLIEQGGDMEQVNQNLLKLKTIRLDVIDQDLHGVSNELKVLIESLKEGRDNFINVEESASVNMSPAITAFNAVGTAADTNKEKVRQLFEMMNQTPQGAVPTKSLGGMIYRQYGGFVPKGTDTIPAMLSPGEFVVNAKSSRQFFSQLVAMNAGTRPVYREQGGPVTNVGDVNITVQGASKPQQTARETMSAFKREMRRQTSSLN